MTVAEEIRFLRTSIGLYSLEKVDFPVIAVIRTCFTALEVSTTLPEEVVFQIDFCIDRLHEKVNIGYWKDVDISVRQCITLLSYFKLLSQLEKQSITDEDVRKAFETIDRGLLFGAPVFTNSFTNDLLQQCALFLNKFKSMKSNDGATDEDAAEQSPIDLEDKFKDITYSGNVPALTEIQRINCPSVESFWNNHFNKHVPAILTNCIFHWPAMKLWQNTNYILEKYGHRVVPVEVGSKYTDSNWTQKLVSIKEFIEENIFKTPTNISYLAQHQLFNQIPDLMSDICEPDYCCLRESSDDSDIDPDGTDINAWFGPCGTISPLHFDPKHNLLAQVVGCKEIILYPPEDSDYMYPHLDNMLQNTSRVDPLEVDDVEFPLFSKGHQYRCILKPGEMLYIPPKWWHYVKSRSISFSVSFWWY